MTQAELAHALDISAPMVSKLKRRGMPVHSVAMAAAWRAANLDPILLKNIRRSEFCRATGHPEPDRAANAARRRRRAAAGTDDDGQMIDPVLCDEALRWQPAAFVERAPANTPEAQIFARWEARLIPAQTEIMSTALLELQRAGGTASDGRAFRTALGKLWGRLRALVDSECDVLEREVAELLAERG